MATYMFMFGLMVVFIHLPIIYSYSHIVFANGERVTQCYYYLQAGYCKTYHIDFLIWESHLGIDFLDGGVDIITCCFLDGSYLHVDFLDGSYLHVDFLDGSYLHVHFLDGSYFTCWFSWW